MAGRVILITGSTDGLGREVARRAAARGADVIVHGRNRERGEALVAEIARSGTGSARFYPADLASLDEVRRFAGAVLRDYRRLDVLVNNAGIWLSDGRRQVSADGYELHFAVNYLSHFLLTHLLLPRLIESAPSRIVNVASGSQSPIDFDDVMLERPGRASRGYGQSKLAQVMFTFDLARELRDRDVTVVALHPATMMDTTMVRKSGLPPQSSVDEGAGAVMHLVASPGVQTGLFYNGTTPWRANMQAYDAAARARLRALSLRLTGLDVQRREH
ncbi:MAG TPA: SDR family NAD(P)-dependent oxidoreductase [Candidatus Tectomicrobia bacterium]|nr:SDR family NAD(P)-dependent oxidoreductase [Candidatus Tectomicrobia bacterium]